MLRATLSAGLLGILIGACFSEDAGKDTGDTSGGDDACQSYCERLQNNCTGDFQQFGTVDDCKATCRFYPAGGDGDQSGHSLGCRATKAASAAEGDQMTFCPPGRSHRRGDLRLALRVLLPARHGHLYGEQRPVDQRAGVPQRVPVLPRPGRGAV